MSKFSNFQTYLTVDQCRQAVQFLDNEEQLIQFFIASYNDYVSQLRCSTRLRSTTGTSSDAVELHSEANLSVITNPDALFRTKEESDTLIYELKQYIRDVVGLPHKEEVQKGNNRSQTAKAKNTKNPR